MGFRSAFIHFKPYADMNMMVLTINSKIFHALKKIATDLKLFEISTQVSSIKSFSSIYIGGGVVILITNRVCKCSSVGRSTDNWRLSVDLGPHQLSVAHRPITFPHSGTDQLIDLSPRQDDEYSGDAFNS